MELIPKNSILEFHSDTLQYLRRQYDLEKPGRMEQAVNLLDDWIKKQPHFLKKDFTKDYLERTIIISKGSVERAKRKLDKICTFRTMYPELFGVHDIRNFQSLNDIYCTFLPKLTEDHYRVYIFKNRAKILNKGFMEFYKFFTMQCEYTQAHDYCNGLIIVHDHREANIMEALKNLNIAEMQRAMAVLKDGYGMRIKGFHVFTESKALDTIVNLFKQAFSGKIAGRIISHKTTDTIYKYIPKDILPVDYGGKEKSMFELHRKFQDVVTTKDFSNYLNDMREACTNEKFRPAHDNSSLGIPGSFRTMSVD